MAYGISTKVAGTFADVLEQTKAALAAEGFGILTEIDVKATMQKKLGVTYDEYVILGACNPPLAHRALQAEKEIGLLLPCNVIVYEADGTVRVSAILPSAAMETVENPDVVAIAREAEEKLRAAVRRITA